MLWIKAKIDWVSRLVGAVSGLLLAIPNLYPILAPLQAAALLPILYLAARRKSRLSVMITVGVYMGLFYTMPQMIVLKLPIPITVILVVHLTVLMTIFVCISKYLLQKPSLLGAFAVGAFLVVLDWVNITIVPIWGTAQSIVRPWSQYPNLIQFTSITGMAGIIFVLGTVQALIICAIINPKLRGRLLAGVGLIILVFAGTNIIIINGQQPVDKLKVAAIGWVNDDSQENYSPQTPEGFEALFAKPAIEAAARGAEFIVSPEIGFYIDKYERGMWLERFQSISNKHNVFLAIGYFNGSKNENRLIFITPDGRTLAEYTKTYLTLFEDSNKGDGRLITFDLNGISAGGMICQDDNFTRFSREYGRGQTAVVAVPTLDWQPVRAAHLQSSIHRAIESRYAIVRAALNGISAVISPTGDVLARRDHFLEGAGFTMAEMPIYKSRTFFSIAGNWLVALSFIFLVINVGRNLPAAWRK